MLSRTAPPSGALVRHSAPHGTFDHVMFPVHTLYCPPMPPSMLMGRYKPPPRPGPVYLNDLSLAGEREHDAQTQVSRVWRGILARRRLRNERNSFHVRTRRAIMIQCWWRSLLAKWRRRQLEELTQEWVERRRDAYLEDRLKGYGVMMTWQRKRFEDAVIKVQRIYRWFRSRQRNAFLDDSDPSKQEELPFPLRHRKKVYFPWRRRERADKEGSLAASNGSGKATRRKERASIQFRKTRKEVFPPDEEEVKVINDAMREREAERALVLSQPEVQDRMQWKREGLLENDLDHNAGMIQRLARYKWSGWDKITRKVTRDYFNRKVWIIQRAFRLAKTLKHISRRQLGLERRAEQKNRAYARAKLDAIEEELAWQFTLYNNAARTIQMAWAHFKHKSRQFDPFMEVDDTAPPPPPPPYNLITEHIEREKSLRAAAATRFLRETEEAKRRALQLGKRFVPAEIKVIDAASMLSPVKGNVQTVNKRGLRLNAEL